MSSAPPATHAGHPGDGPVAAHLAIARTALEAAYADIRNGTEASPGAADVLRQIRDTQTLIDLTQAIQTHRLAQHAGTITHYDPHFTDSPTPEAGSTGAEADGTASQTTLTDGAGGSALPFGDGRRPARAHRAARGQLGDLQDRAVSDVAALLQWGPRTAARRLREAVDAVTLTPVLVDELADGTIDRERVAAVTGALTDVAEPDKAWVAEQVEHGMLTGPRGGIGAWTPTSTRKRATAAVAQIDATTTARARERKIRQAEGLWFAPGKIAGTTDLHATLRTEQAAQIRAVVERLAWAYRTGQTEPTSAHPEEPTQQPGRETAASQAGHNETGDSMVARPDGTGESEAVGPAETSDSATGQPVGVVDQAAADAAEAARQDLTLGQCRTQALADLLLTNTRIEADCTFLIPVRNPADHSALAAFAQLGPALDTSGQQLALSATGEAMHPDDFADWVAHHPPPPPEDGFWTDLEDPPPNPTDCAGPTDPADPSGRTDSADQRAPADPAHPAGPGEQVGASPGEHGTRASSGPRDSSEVSLPDWIPPTRRSADARGEAMRAVLDHLGVLHAAYDPTLAGARPTSPATPDPWAPGHPGDITIPGVGTIPADITPGLIATLGTTVGRALLEETTGTLREHTVNAYRPPKKMRAFVELRDATCRFPGCTRPAEYTDIDHLTPYGHPHDGKTSPTNLIHLCRIHHLAKHSGAWTVQLHPDGTITWTNFAGHTLTSYPAHEPDPPF